LSIKLNHYFKRYEKNLFHNCNSVFNLYFSQQKKYSDYYDIKKNYENYPENDSRAFVFLDQYIKLAKQKKDYDRLAQGYEDAVFYSASSVDKLKYADSTVYAALLSKNNDIISDAYLGKRNYLLFQLQKI
jgi:hypothetical protein